MINVLIACEESQRVCLAFRRRGFNAFSCDILPCSGGAEAMAEQWGDFLLSEVFKNDSTS